ncbi:unnamed protein product, partial [Ectocarpus sp. 13 AM-2016]
DIKSSGRCAYSRNAPRVTRGTDITPNRKDVEQQWRGPVFPPTMVASWWCQGAS